MAAQRPGHRHVESVGRRTVERDSQDGAAALRAQPGQLFGTAGPLAVINVHGPMMFACSTFEYWMGACPDELLCQADEVSTRLAALLHQPLIGGPLAIQQC